MLADAQTNGGQGCAPALNVEDLGRLGISLTLAVHQMDSPVLSLQTSGADHAVEHNAQALQPRVILYNELLVSYQAKAGIC